MARSQTARVWTLAVSALCLLAAAAGHLSGPGDALSRTTAPVAVGILSSAPDAAVLPARISEEVRVNAQISTSRLLVLVAALAVLVGLPAAMCHRATVAGRDDKRLRARRHAIALRAPPLQFV